MTVSRCDNVKGLLLGTNLQRIITWICSSPRLYRALKWVSAHCLAVRPKTSLFWITLTDLISSFLASAGSCFQRKSSTKIHDLFSTKQHTDTVNNYLVNKGEHLAAKETDIPLWSWWRPKTELRDMTPNEWKRCSITALCVNRQLFANKKTEQWLNAHKKYLKQIPIKHHISVLHSNCLIFPTHKEP